MKKIDLTRAQREFVTTYAKHVVTGRTAEGIITNFLNSVAQDHGHKEGERMVLDYNNCDALYVLEEGDVGDPDLAPEPKKPLVN